MSYIYERVRFIIGGMGTKRFHTQRTIQENTVAHHSCGVAILVFELSDGKPSIDLVRAALLHDMAEHKLGDMPAPAKRLLGIRELFNGKEEALLNSIWLLNSLTTEEEIILKMADALDGALFCVSELSLGNSGIIECYDNFISYALELNPISNIQHLVIAAVRAQWQEAMKNGR
jgi:5'-deoxynucleotidase YfbR-like HD superfamily hydrolase